MNRNGKRITLATLGVLSLLIGVGGVVAPVFAWSVTSFTTTASASTAAIGTGIYDQATLQLTSDGGPYGTITFYAYTGSCNVDGHPTGTLVYTSPAVTVTTSSKTTYTSATASTIGWTAGSYVWVAKYSGTGSGGYPSKTAACEPFSLFSGGPPPTVPEFPLGFAALMALAIPVMLLVRSKYSAQATR